MNLYEFLAERVQLLNWRSIRGNINLNTTQAPVIEILFNFQASHAGPNINRILLINKPTPQSHELHQTTARTVKRHPSSFPLSPSTFLRFHFHVEFNCRWHFNEKQRPTSVTIYEKS